jgi:ABC-type nitrate/sulfonate/bicarbonate transport system ATPase subunit
MKKRLGFARCFARFPGAVLLDEPFAGLHREARRELWDKLFGLLHRHPVPAVIVTHFPEEVPQTERCSFYIMERPPARTVRTALPAAHTLLPDMEFNQTGTSP